MTPKYVGFVITIRRAADSWGVGFANRMVTPRAVAACSRALGLATTVYTINEPTRMREVAAFGVTGMFRDRPSLARRTLAPRSG